MILRAVTLAAGVLGGAGLSQFPEFSQQYMQRLGGAVDELSRQVVRYENDATQAGQSLDAYLGAMAKEGPIGTTQSENISSDIARHQALSQALSALEGAGPFTRARLAAWMGDRDIAGRAFESYKPAAPLTFEGALFAGVGFLGGWLGLAAVFAFVSGGWAFVTGFKRRPRQG